MSTRTAHGQAIAEAGAGMTLFAMFSVLGIAMLVNGVSLAALFSKANYVAHCAAKVSGESGWFMGMERTNAAKARAEAEKKAEEIAAAVARSVGLPEASSFVFDQTVNGDAIVTKVHVDFPAIELPFTLGIFPNRISIKAEGVSTDYAYGPTCALNFEVPATNGAVRAVQMPALFSYRREGEKITRDFFGGGGKFNTELGLFQGGLLLQSSASNYNKYWQGFNGTSVSTANNTGGATHGALPQGSTSLD